MVNVNEFLEKYDMNYKVSKCQSAFKLPDGTYVDVDDQYHLVRSTDNQAIDPATVKGGYVASNPQKLIAPLEPMIAEGWITPDRGFIFKNGSYEVLSFRIDGGSLEDKGRIGGESWDHFVSVHNHQGGGGKIKGSIHSHRIICKNTAVAAARMASFAIRHTGQVEENYQWAVQTWKKLQEEIRKISERMTVFADFKVSASDAEGLFRDLYGVKGKSNDEISTRTANELEFAMIEFANPRRGTYGKSFADVYNAITSTNSHYSPKNSKEDGTKRLVTLFDEQGSRHKLEAATMDTLLKMVG